MSKLQELKQQLDKIQKEIQNLESRDWPKPYDEYYLVSSNGAVLSYTWEGAPDDEDFKSQGHIFKTKSEAVSEHLSRKIVQELWQCEGARKYVIGKPNWSITLDSWEVCYDLGGASYFSVYFDSQDQVANAIKTVGADRLNKVLDWREFGKTFTEEK